MKELGKAKRRSGLAKNAAESRWVNGDANGIGSSDASAMPPTPTLIETLSDRSHQVVVDALKKECFETAREMFPKTDPGALVKKLLQVMSPYDVLSLIETARAKKDPWQYLWGALRKQAKETEEAKRKATEPHPADKFIWGDGGAA